MLRESVIAEVAEKQKANVLGRSPGMSRLERLGNVPPGFASVVTGVRRCGKSTLMEQLMRSAPNEAFYLNFESTALAGIELKDAGRIDRAIAAVGARHLYFDEVQQMKGWERYVRTKLDEGFDVTVTGSNASIFDRELGTKLTGRHVVCELFPFDEGSGECDFVPVRRKRAGDPVQATVALNDESEEREITGMRSAMRSLGRKRGWIVTIGDDDELSFDEGTVRIVPFHKFKPEETLTK